MRSLGTLGDDFSEAYDINDSSQVVGVSNISDNTYRAFLWEEGEGMLNLGTLPGGDFSSAYGINNNGQVIGFATEAGNNERAFLWEAGTGMQSLGVLPGANASYASDINDSGVVVGNSGRYEGAFLWDKDEGIQSLGTLGGTWSTAYGINNSGQVVGTSEKSNGPVVAYLWEDGVMQDLNDLIDPASGWDLIDAYAINDAGQILGYGGRAGTGGELFLLTPVAPVPLPAVVWLMLSGLASLGRLKHRRAAAC